AKAVEQVAARRPLQPQVWFILGELRLELGLADAGEDALLTELQHHPFSGATRAMLAQLYVEQNRLVDAVKILRPMLNVNPEDPIANALTATAYLKMKRPDRAAPHQARCAGFEGCP
ncbi:tetratricopeptide repeat protein, partial [Myxococcota bacterium]|nr:tetratricopeptide repeat protein [Myxococcota bacterium]